MPVSFCADGDRGIILWAAILASSMGFIDSSVTSIALPAMREALLSDPGIERDLATRFA